MSPCVGFDFKDRGEKTVTVTKFFFHSQDSQESLFILIFSIGQTLACSALQ